MKKGKEKIGLIYEAWDSYATQAMPVGAPEVQVLECKRAFAAGYFSAFDFLASTALHPKNEDDSVKLMSEGHEAMLRFIQEAAGS